MKISIFGLGYLGSVSLACLVRDGHTVTGVDIDATKLRLIASGQSPVIEDGMDTLMAASAASGRLLVTQDARQAVLDTGLSFITVGTPSLPNGSQDQAAVLAITQSLGQALRDKADYHIFVFRSTLVPGTVEDVLKPLLEEHSGKRCGQDFDVCFQPEFLREGTSIRDYDNPPFTIIGSSSARAEAVLREIFGHLPGGFQSPSIRTAEMVKYCCNNFHALKITFANEVARWCNAMGGDPFEVMDLVCQDRQLNISPAYLKPGFAFGGSCLPKDLRATLHMARSRNVKLPLLESLLPSNRIHIHAALDKVLTEGRRKVAMVGLSFKSGTDDLRESPLVALAEQLIGKGFQLSIYAPRVHLSRLIGANKSYIERTIPHIGELLNNDLAVAVSGAETVIVGLSDRDVQAALIPLLTPQHYVLDLVHMSGSDRLPCRWQGVCW